jgi:hypothetical protein
MAIIRIFILSSLLAVPVGRTAGLVYPLNCIIPELLKDRETVGSRLNKDRSGPLNEAKNNRGVLTGPSELQRFSDKIMKA